MGDMFRQEGRWFDEDVVDQLNSIFSDDNDWSMEVWGEILNGISVEDINAEIYNLLAQKYGGKKRDKAKVEKVVNAWRAKKAAQRNRS